MEDLLPDSFISGVGPIVTPPKAPSCQVKSPCPRKQPLPSLTCNWCVQVVAEALAKAEELNGPELAARIRSLKDPQAARLQVISHAWLLLITQNSLYT